MSHLSFLMPVFLVARYIFLLIRFASGVSCRITVRRMRRRRALAVLRARSLNLARIISRSRRLPSAWRSDFSRFRSFEALPVAIAVPTESDAHGESQTWFNSASRLIAAQAGIQPLTRNADQLGSLELVAAGRDQRALDKVAFGLAEAQRGGVRGRTIGEATTSANGTRRPASATPIRRIRITNCSKVPRAASQS